MEKSSSDLHKSVHEISDEIDLLPIDQVKLSDEEIFQLFPDLNEEQIDKIKNDLINFSQILYKKYR